MSDGTTAQGKAMEWLARDDPAALDFDTTGFNILAERYVLALLYFASNGLNWAQQYSFLSSNSVCEWNGDEVGTFCDQNGNIVEIVLCKSCIVG